MFFSTAILPLALIQIVACHSGHQYDEQKVLGDPPRWERINTLFLEFEDPTLAALKLEAQQSIVNKNKTLVPFIYEELPLGSIKPLGWILDQLTLEANGLPGHLFDFYKFVHDSPWIGGGSEYSQLNEAAPYWYNGIVPLAYLLGDDRIIAQANAFLHYVLDNQAPDGWLGPETTNQTRGVWARCVLLQGMMNHAIADPSQTDRIVTAMLNYASLAYKMLKNNYQGYLEGPGDNFDHYGFGILRAHDFSTSLQWLYENHPRGQKKMLWEIMNLMWSGAEVAKKDWTTFFTEDGFNKGASHNEAPFEHGVNLAEGLRNPAQFYRLSHNQSLVDMTYWAINQTIKYHGANSGTIIADEYLGALNPQRGSELCMAVEMMYSMSYLYRLFGENSWADQAELTAFNALPAAISPDWWSHEYVTQMNQPWAKRFENDHKPYFNTNPSANSFGMDTNYPCCTVNHVQGYPKFFQSSFVTKGSNTLVHQYLVPGKVTTKLGKSQLTVTCQTNYPFSNTLSYIIDTTSPFTFSIRVPNWALNSSTISINRGPPSPFTRSPHNLHSIHISNRTTLITVSLAIETRIVPRESNTVAIYRGPLLYALSIAQNITSFPPLSFESANTQPTDDEWTLYPLTQDYSIVPIPRTPGSVRTDNIWNIAIDPEQIIVHEEVHGLPNPLWDDETSPLWLDVAATEIEWGLDQGTAAPPPEEKNVKMLGRPFWTKWVPYGGAKIHMGEVPRIKLEKLESVSIERVEEKGEGVDQRHVDL